MVSRRKVTRQFLSQSVLVVTLKFSDLTWTRAALA